MQSVTDSEGRVWTKEYLQRVRNAGHLQALGAEREIAESTDARDAGRAAETWAEGLLAQFDKEA